VEHLRSLDVEGDRDSYSLLLQVVHARHWLSSLLSQWLILQLVQWWSVSRTQVDPVAGVPLGQLHVLRRHLRSWVALGTCASTCDAKQVVWDVHSFPEKESSGWYASFEQGLHLLSVVL
jgi:hypothetical protein